MTVGDLARLMRTEEPHGGLACFGDTPITVKGQVEMSCGEARPTWQVEPEWLGPHAFYTLALSDGTEVVSAHLPPGARLSRRIATSSTRPPHTIRAHFEDGDAATCDGPAPGGTSASDARALISYWCRTALVVDQIDPMPGVVAP